MHQMKLTDDGVYLAFTNFLLEAVNAEGQSADLSQQATIFRQEIDRNEKFHPRTKTRLWSFVSVTCTPIVSVCYVGC